MLLYHYSNEPYTALKTKLAQGVMTPAMMAEEDTYVTYRNDAFPSYKAISLLPDPIPLDIMGALYAGHDHHIWIPNHVIYEHVVDSRRLPRFDYHISETPDDVKQMMADWPDDITQAQKRAYFRAKSKRKWRTGEYVQLVKLAPFGDPVIIQVLDAPVIVRRADLAGVTVV